MKKTNNKKVAADWRAMMSQSTTHIINMLDNLYKDLLKNKKHINRDIKMYGKKGSEAEELFDHFVLSVDKRATEIRDIIED